MKMLLLDAARLFYERKFIASLKLTNAHFEAACGQQLVRLEGFLLPKINFEDFEEYSLWIIAINKACWSGNVRIGLVFKELWEYFPSQRILEQIWAFDRSDFFYDSIGFEMAAFDALRLFELYEIVEDGIRQGQILPFGSLNQTWGLPNLSEEMKFLLDQGLDNFHSVKLQTAIKKGFSGRTHNHFEKLPVQQHIFLTRWVFLQSFFPTQDVNYQLQRLWNFDRGAEPIVSIISQALRNHMDSIPDDDDLSDFIFLYTGGRVLPDDPREWMQLFIKSIETGKVLIPPV